MSEMPERDLLVAVQEALTLPWDADGYDSRMAERADWVRSAITGFLDEGDPTWHANWLRTRLRNDEARRAGGEQP